jgi:4-carboxymuconolactone decarboxylase
MKNCKPNLIGDNSSPFLGVRMTTLTHCEYCIDMGSAIYRQWGLTDEELLALPNYQTSPLLSELDKVSRTTP